MIIYFARPELFAREVNVWVHDLAVDEDDKWVKIMKSNNKTFATELAAHNKENDG